MSEICSFVGDCDTPCPVDESVIKLSGVCESDAFGENCGPVAGYGALVGQYDKLKTADAVNPILGTFTFNTVPGGYPPQNIREHWLGVEVPVRKPESLQYGEVEVAPADAFLSLLRAGKLEAAGWFMTSGLQLDYLGPTWVFQTTEGSHNELSAPVSSTEFYGNTVASEVRVIIERDDPTIAEEDFELPPVDVQADILMMHDQMTTFPDKNNVGTPGMLAIELWKAGKITSLATFEGWLRQMNSEVHLIAVPLDFYGESNPGHTSYMGCKEGEPEYTAWIGLHGEFEAEGMLEHLALTHDKNLERLKTTGFLTI